MGIVVTCVLLILGLALLIKGSDFFVEGSAGLAHNFKVPPLIVGLTIMAFGTSSPEVFIGVRSALNGTTSLAIGNVIGSDIFNLIFIIGLAALIRPMKVKFKEISRDFWVAIAGPILLLLMMLYFDTEIPRLGGIFFLFLFAIYIIWIIFATTKKRKELKNQETLEDFVPRPLKHNILLGIFGLVLILVGGELTVHNAVSIAESLGMSPRLVGLTIIAMGTSLPELIIVLTASKRGDNEMAVGNIIGSSIFNIMFVLGLTGTVAPLPIEIRFIWDLLFLIGASFVFLIFVLTRKKLTRLEGGVMVLMFLAYFGHSIFS